MNQTICMICLQECLITFSIFTKQKDWSPYEKLYKLKLIEIIPPGSFSMCSECLTELDICVKFFEKCERRDLPKPNTDFAEYSTAKVVNENIIDDEAVSPVIDGSYDINKSAKSQDSKCGSCASKRNCNHKPPTLYTCQYCSKVFTKKFNHNIHVKRHLGLRDWPCIACRAPQLSSWHAKTHCKPGPRFICPDPGCSRSYTSAHNLNVHIRSHTGERPYECHDCGKRFASKTTLTDHIRTHSGIKPYMCSICGARFTTNKIMAHMKTHTEKSKLRDPHRSSVEKKLSQKSTSYACTHCPMQYSHKQSLNRHLKKRHTNLEVLYSAKSLG